MKYRQLSDIIDGYKFTHHAKGIANKKKRIAPRMSARGILVETSFCGGYMVKVSVIMPSLNVAKYIKQCMESVLSQSLKEIEVLAIDAGSTDGTLEILKTYAQNDERVKVVMSEMKSYGYQVNKGIQLANGKYISIVETDDILAENALSKLYESAEEYSVDYVKGYFKYFYHNVNSGNVTNVKTLPQKEYDENRGVVLLTPKKRPQLVLCDYYIWTGMYKREFLDTIRCNETPGAAYQDIGFLLQVHSKANKAIYLDQLVYYYRKDNDNASCYNRKAFSYLVEEYSYVEELLSQLSKEWTQVCRCKVFRQMKVRFMIMAESGEFWNEARKSISELINMLEDSIKNKNVNMKLLTDDEQMELANMIDDVNEYYRSCEKRNDFRKKDVQYLCQKKDNKKIIIYGCGMWGRFLTSVLRTYVENPVFAYCDSNENLWGTCIEGLSVLSPKEAVQKHSDSLFVIANKNASKEIKENLLNWGVKENMIFIFKHGMDDALFRLDIK